MFEEYVDRDILDVTPINVINSVPQKQSEMNCEDRGLEEMNFSYLLFDKSDPTCSKLQNSEAGLLSSYAWLVTVTNCTYKLVKKVVSK